MSFQSSQTVVWKKEKKSDRSLWIAGKFDPTVQGHWREVDYMTNALTIEQVLVYSEAYGFFPHQVTTDFDKYCCANGTAVPAVTGTTVLTHATDANQCDIVHCKSPGNPLPLLTIAPSNLAPDLRMVLRSIDAMFTSLQAQFTQTTPSQPVVVTQG